MYFYPLDTFTFFRRRHFYWATRLRLQAGQLKANALMKRVKNVTQHLKCLSGNKCCWENFFVVVVLVNIKTSGYEKNCLLNAVLLTIWKRPFRLHKKKMLIMVTQKYFPHQTEGTFSLHPCLSFDPWLREAGLVKVVYTRL